MRVREIKREDVKAGMRVVNNAYDINTHDIGRLNRLSVKVASLGTHPTGKDIVFYESGGWDRVDDLLSFYWLIEEEKPTGIPTFDGQIGGDHYNKNDPIQFARDNYPVEQLEGFFRINVDKYVARYDKKNGLEDLKKARHYLDMLIELKENQDAE